MRNEAAEDAEVFYAGCGAWGGTSEFRCGSQCGQSIFVIMMLSRERVRMTTTDETQQAAQLGPRTVSDGPCVLEG